MTALEPVDRLPPDALELAGLAAVALAAAVAVLSLVLGLVGWHDGALALAGGVVATGVGCVVVARLRRWPITHVAWSAAAALAVVLTVATVQAFPGFPFAAKNRDPGVYVNHAVAIAGQGSVTLSDPVFATGADVVVGEDGVVRIVTDQGDIAWRRLPYRSMPTDPDDPEHILPDFFHLWPSSLATAHDLAGTTGLFNLTPLFAVGAVGLMFLATRRAFGLMAATVASGLLALNELQVWQAKFPTAEAMAQCLYAGALLALVVALACRWRPAAALAGALVGVGFVARPEGILLVALAAAVLAGLWAFDRLDGRAVAFAVGLAPMLALGAYQAYGRDSRYARLQEGLPSFREAVAGAVLLVVLAVVVRLLRPRLEPRLAGVDRRRWLTVAGYAAVTGFALFLVVAWFREELLGQNFRVNKSGDRTRGYDELNLKRLALFVTPMALVAAVGALVLGVRERWGPARWVLVVPGLLITPVLVWEPRIAPDLMWWGRRYVPMVVPTLLILTGVAVAWLWTQGNRRNLARVGAVVVVLAMAGWMLRQSSDLWGHREFDGSLAVVEAVDEVIGDEDAIVVWDGSSTLITEFAVTPFTWLDQPGLAGPDRPNAAVLLALQEAMGDRPLYLVSDGAAPPPNAADALVEERRIVGELSQFEYGLAERPRQARSIPVDLTVWRLDG